jgi:hypothetical protein
MRLAALATVVALVFAASPAQACWDGYQAGVGRVGVLEASLVGEWSPQEALHVARWLSRTERLLPPDAELFVELGHATCEGPGCGSAREFEVDLDDWPQAFDVIAARLGASRETIDAARALEPKVFTVQVFAGSRAGATIIKQKVLAAGKSLHGFYSAGGFPAPHDDAHILRDGATYRVVVGAFLDEAEARAALAELKAENIEGFVRALPSLPTFEEKSSSSAG